MGYQGAEIRRELTLRNGLQERSQHEAEIITWIEPMPKRTCSKGRETSSEARFFAFWRDAEIHVVSQPVVGVHIPVFEVGSRILRGFDTPRIDVLKSVPLHSACFGVYAFVAHAGEDAGAFGQIPDAIVFHTGNETEHFEVPNSPEEAVLKVLIAED